VETVESDWAISAHVGCDWEATSSAQALGKVGNKERVLSPTPGQSLDGDNYFTQERRVGQEVPAGTASQISPPSCSQLELDGRSQGSNVGCPRREAEGQCPG